ncbi:MAG: type II secretion system protein GspD [Aureliella sp.]
MPLHWLPSAVHVAAVRFTVVRFAAVMTTVIAALGTIDLAHAQLPHAPNQVRQATYLNTQQSTLPVPTNLPSAPEAVPTQGGGQVANPFDMFNSARDMFEPSADEQRVRVPIQRSVPNSENLKITSHNASQLVSIYANNIDLRTVLAQLAEESQVNIVVAEGVDASVTTTLADVPLWDALDAILKINGLVWIRKGQIIFVTKPVGGGAEGRSGGSMPGQRLQVFDLYYTSAAEVLEVVNGLLSPAGRAFQHAVDATSTRQTRERVVVEDYPDRLEAVASYLANVDNPPLQVLIEANVMQVTLDSDQRHGVNFDGLARLSGARVNLQAQGFANGSSSPGFMMGLEGTDLDGMIETLCSTSNVETLAAPKVLVVNGQQARIQIGSKFGYFVTTTTETSTLQSVDFLDIGVVLQVTPTITHDGKVLLSVTPKVSGGRINPDTGLPEEDTTEAETTVLLPDGKGMIIGGLIKESNDHKKWWVPFLGERPFIGKLFSRTNDDVQRVEVVIALTPHIVPYGEPLDHREYHQFSRSTNSTAPDDYYFRSRDWRALGGELPNAHVAPAMIQNQPLELEQTISLDNLEGLPTVPDSLHLDPISGAQSNTANVGVIGQNGITQKIPLTDPPAAAVMQPLPSVETSLHELGRSLQPPSGTAVPPPAASWNGSQAPIIPGAPTVPGR